MGTESVLETEPLKTGKPETEQKTEEIPKLDPNMKIQLEDGSSVVLGEAIRSHQQAQVDAAKPQIDPDQLEEFNLYQRAKGGDQEAVQEILKINAPKKEEEVIDPNSQQGQILTLQGEIKELKTVAEQTGRVSKSIVDAANAQQAAQLVEAGKEQFPWLAQHPGASAKLIRRIEDLNAAAQQNNVDPSVPAMAEKIRVAAFQSLNEEIEKEMASFGVTADSLKTLKSEVAKNQPKNQIVDDQKGGDRVLIDENGVLNSEYSDGRRFASDALDGDIPAIRSRFAVTGMGELIERGTERLYANPQDAKTGNTRPIESNMLRGTPQSQQELLDQGRVSMSGLLQQLKARQEEMGS